MVGWHHWFKGTWVWASSGRWWRTGKPGVLQSMGSQRVGHDCAAKHQQKRPASVFQSLPGNLKSPEAHSGSLYLTSWGRLSLTFFIPTKWHQQPPTPPPVSWGLHSWLGGYHDRYLPKTLLHTKHSLVSPLTLIIASLYRKLAQEGCGLLKVTQLLNHKDTALNLSPDSCTTADPHLSSWQDKPLFFSLLQKHSL